MPVKCKAMTSIGKDDIYNITMKQDLLCLIMAYPEYIAEIETEADGRVYIVMKSGNKILYDDKKQKTPSEKLSNPDLQDMLEQIYPLSPAGSVMKENFDPGRCRVYKLLSEVYGSSKKSIESNLVSLNSGYRFNGSNNAAESLKAAMNQLIPLAQHNNTISNCLFPMGGTYNYRIIAGTNQLSPHSYGIAIDMAVNNKDYWRWASKEEGDKRISSYPNEIVEVFEKNNFIWGGKWCHFDIMHFEYRPEIILKARYFSNKQSTDKPWYDGVPLNDAFIKKSIDKINKALKTEEASTAAGISKDEAVNDIKLIFINRNKALLTGDSEFIDSIYDRETKYGNWAYEYEIRKMKYIRNWAAKQGVKFTEINPLVVIKKITGNNNNYSVYLLCSTEYKYIYEDQPDVENSSRIGTYHILNLVNRDGNWAIIKEWYKDPFGDSLNLDNIKVNSIKEYIMTQNQKDFAGLNSRRIDAAAYAKKYCGAASEEQFGFKYNNNYRDYNLEGGDCANFASQILYEGGKFKKNSAWNYDSGDATAAWLNADSFKNYMINSGRASLIAYGNYDKVYKASFKLMPGDFVAYEKKGDINHISVVTGADSKGYTLVTCHNSDRNNVPWDLGWSNKNIRFWLIRVHY
jgi:hypothetical protein